MGVLRNLGRGVRVALALVVVEGVRERNPGAIANALIGLVGTALPWLGERVFDVELEPWQRAYAETAMLVHALGMLGPYDDTWWWDHLTHTYSATLLGSIVFAVSRRRGRDPAPRVVAVVVCAGVLWEGLEYLIHSAANRLGFEPILVSYGRRDTLFDLLFNLLGAMLVLVFGDRLLANLSGRSGRDGPG